MTTQDIEKTVINALRQVAPDIDIADVDRSEELREQFDIDSMDFLNLIIRLSKEYSVKIPESDYPLLSSVDAIVHYIDDAVST